MKYLDCYKELFNCSCEDEVFSYIIENLKPSNNLWSYFVNWEKVYSNVRNMEMGLNLLNYLIGKEDFDKEFKILVKEHPKVIAILPSLVVSREKQFNILVDYKSKKLRYENYDFTIEDPTDEDVEKYLHFVKESGLKELICCGKIKSLVDYMIGVEAGLDSNGRKNRGGRSMEAITDVFIKDICRTKGYEFLIEANSDRIKKTFGVDVPVDKMSRRYDYVVKTNKEIVLFEVNFYGGNGSMLKSTAGEYRNLYDILENKFKFIWITDGIGWHMISRPLRETFDHNEYIVTLDMLEKGILNHLL